MPRASPSPVVEPSPNDLLVVFEAMSVESRELLLAVAQRFAKADRLARVQG